MNLLRTLEDEIGRENIRYLYERIPSIIKYDFYNLLYFLTKKGRFTRKLIDQLNHEIAIIQKYPTVTPQEYVSRSLTNMVERRSKLEEKL